jgi:hypothetical protein
LYKPSNSASIENQSWSNHQLEIEYASFTSPLGTTSKIMQFDTKKRLMELILSKRQYITLIFNKTTPQLQHLL